MCLCVGVLPCHLVSFVSVLYVYTLQCVCVLLLCLHVQVLHLNVCTSLIHKLLTYVYM